MTIHGVILELSDVFLASVFVREPVHLSTAMELAIFEVTGKENTRSLLS